MPNCDICSEFPQDDPRTDIHPAVYEVRHQGTNTLVCRKMLGETIQGIADYEGMEPRATITVRLI